MRYPRSPRATTARGFTKVSKGILTLWVLAAGLATHANVQAAMPTESQQRTEYYRRAFAQAQHFVVQRIPADMLDPADQGNDTYLEVYDAQKKLLGYVRDFTGPVSPAAQCPCNPLSVSLVFDANRTLKTILSPQPLQKYGHAPMRSEELERLLQILRQLPPKLCRVQNVEDMVDATTGATQHVYQDVVVAQAALSTRRLAGIVQQTLHILHKTPQDVEQARLNSLSQRYQNQPDLLAQRLSDWLAKIHPNRENAVLRQNIWRVLVRACDAAASNNKPVATPTRAQIINIKLLDTVRPADMASACLRLSRYGDDGDFVSSCLTHLSPQYDAQLPADILAQLRGVDALQHQDFSKAEQALQSAAQHHTVADAPHLFFELAEAHRGLGHFDKACSLAKSLWQQHPLLTGADTLLATCLQAGQAPESPHDMPTLKQALTDQAHTEFIEHLIPAHDAKQAPALQLLSPTEKNVMLSLADPRRLTVVVFFATWCPHCRTELPQLIRFVDELDIAGRNQIRILGIRTAKERETIAYAQFEEQFPINFPVYVDSTMSGSFLKFTQAHQLPMTLPTTVMIDTQGRLRAVLETGDYQNIGREIAWAIEAINCTKPKKHKGF